MSSPRGLCDIDRCTAPVKRGKMTEAISLPFLSMALQDEGCLWVWECVSEGERETEGEYETQRNAREREPLGSNKSGLHWTGESWRILCGKTGVHSILGQRLWSATSVISHNTHTDTGWAEITQRQNPFPLLVPHYHVTALCFIFGFVLMWNTAVIK